MQPSSPNLQYQWGHENRLGPAKTLGFVKVRTLGFVKCITLDFVGVYIGPLMSDFRNWALDLFVAKFLRCMALMSFWILEFLVLLSDFKICKVFC